ncbi:MAG: MFS transporter [Deltaproteobacteria bacterium]|nr:MFS transporter [Deltaproteobacteria bacterium]
MPRTDRILITLATLLGISLASIEITVVGTAAPLIVRELGGFESYSWIFTMYLLTGAVSMPFWGRAADHWGRKKIFTICMTIFLAGSILCAIAPDFNTLVIFRGIKGIGGGGIIPIAFTIIADIYDIKGRTKIQGLISSIWGVSSLIGPFIGGALAETLGWRWIFYINLFPGGIALYFIIRFYPKQNTTTEKLTLSLPSLLGAALFMIALLIGLNFFQKHQNATALLFILISVLSAILFLYSEKNSPHPLVPPRLLKHAVFNMTCITGFLCSAFLVGLVGFLPLFFQVILKHTPTVSGLVLFPFTISWVVFSILSTRLLLKYNYKKLICIGFIFTFLGMLIFMLLFFNLTIPVTALCVVVMGTGMAFNYPILLIVTQYDSPKELIGFATSAIFWVRNMGSTIGTGLMGIVLAVCFKSGLHDLVPTEQTKNAINFLSQNMDALLKPQVLSLIASLPPIQYILHTSIFFAFMILLAALFLNLLCLFFFPKNAGDVAGTRTP